LTDVALIEAPTAEDEAEVAALILRHAVETPGRTAALVARDRLLARRVAIRLQAWGIRVDDSAGRPFRKTIPGAFLDLLLEAVASEFAPAATMALLKHPLTRLGLDAFEVRRAARALEIGAFRKTYLGRGLDGIDAALEHTIGEIDANRRVSRAARRVWPEDWVAAREVVRRLREATTDLVALFATRERHPVPTLARLHAASAEAVATLKEPREGNPLWDEEAGELASTFFAALSDNDLRAPPLHADEYPDFYRGLIGMEAVRPRIPVHPRVFIWGPFESRLQQPDVIVIGGLNEGTWPETLDPGPWLSRPMLSQLGLPVPEDRLGYAAHDFSSAMGAREVFLTRAEKSDGVPRVASRWLLRLKGLLDGLGLRDALQPADPWLAWAFARTVPGSRPPARAPAPRPPLALRPRQLSVSDVETWIANPYAIYASRILRLEPLPPLGERPDAALRGAMVHGALSRFAAVHPDALPNDPLTALNALARDVLGEWSHDPRIAAFWLPRFARFATWFAATEAERRSGLVRQLAEVNGKLLLAAPLGPFTVTARADRVDVLSAGVVISDYKTMTASGLDALTRRALSTAAPQLLLEALIAAKGGFENVPAGVCGLRYISASGGEPPGCDRTLPSEKIPELLADIERQLAALIARYDDEQTPYTALRRPLFDYTFDDFAHLARVDEWSTAEPVEE
jgi:ATP-dependent helicase/nuclease subunit B